MKIKSLLTSAGAIAAAAFIAVMPAQADTVSLEQTVAGGGYNVFGENHRERMYRGVTIMNGQEEMRVAAGAFRVTESGTDNDWLAFCVDLFQHFGAPADFTVNAGLFGQTVVDRLDKLYTNYFDTVTNDTRAASFQLAIWEIVSDDDLDLRSGQFSVANNSRWLRRTTNRLLNGLDDLNGGDYQLTFYENDEYQDLVVGNLTPVPLPATGLLLLVGLGAMGVARRKTK